MGGGGVVATYRVHRAGGEVEGGALGGCLALKGADQGKPWTAAAHTRNQLSHGQLPQTCMTTTPPVLSPATVTITSASKVVHRRRVASGQRRGTARGV